MSKRRAYSRIKQPYLFFALWFAFSVSHRDSYAQTLKPLFFHHLTKADNLSQATNGFIFKDSRGFVWISSNEGLNRYDGKNIINYQPNPNDPFSLYGQNIQSYFFEDEEGNVWFSTYEALNCYVRKKNHFLHYMLNDTIKGYHVAGLDEHKILWIIVGKKDLYHFNIKNKQWAFAHELFEGVHRGLFQKNRQNEVYRFMAYSYDSKAPGLQISEYTDGKLSRQEHYFSGSDKYNLPLRRLWKFFPERDTLIWIVTPEELGAFNPVSKTLSSYNKMNGAPIRGGSAVRPYQDSLLAVSTLNNGLFFFNKHTRQFTNQYTYREKDPYALSSNHIDNIYIDDQNGIWLTLDKIGVDYALAEKVKFKSYFSTRDGGYNGSQIGFRNFLSDQSGSVWAATSNAGIIRFDKGFNIVEIFDSKTQPELSTSRIIYIFKDNIGQIWILTWKGVFILTREKSIRKITDEIFLHGTQLKNGKIILSKYEPGGIWQTSAADDYQISIAPNIGQGKEYGILYENKSGRVYASEDYSRLIEFDPSEDFRKKNTFEVRGEIFSLFEPPGDSLLLIASSYGLVKLNKANREIRYFTEREGLPGSAIYGLVADSKNQLWVSTNNGLSVLDSSYQILTAFGITDGLSALEFSPYAALKKTNGEVLFGSTDGLTAFSPETISSRLPLPQVQITGIKINDEAWPGLKCSINEEATNPGEIVALKLNYARNTISFEFVALEYGDPSKNQLEYKMQHVDDNWINCGNNGFARYPNLPPGRYQFQIKAANSDGAWCEPKSIEIIIIPPIWQRWWFITLAAIAVLAAMYGIYRYRLNQLLKVERLRNQISSDLHDDIGSTLSNVAILSTLAKQKVAADNEASALLERIDEEVQSSSESLDDIIWSINPKNDTMDRILARMRRFASEVFEAKEINGLIDFSLEAKNLSLSMDKRRHFYLLFKEAVNNLAKYSRCKNAAVRTSYHNGYMRLVVSDDGVGFNPDKVKEGSNGLATMKRRADELKGNLDIQSAIGKGTTVTVLVPVTETRDRNNS